MIRLKRVYEPASKEDGFRILVDRLWPRGLSKARAKVDLWLKDVAPSDAVRKQFHHDPKKWIEFQKRYAAELKTNPALKELRKVIREKKNVTFVYGARDTERNQAVVLKKFLV